MFEFRVHLSFITFFENFGASHFSNTETGNDRVK